jgi:hypothetical protein
MIGHGSREREREQLMQESHPYFLSSDSERLLQVKVHTKDFLGDLGMSMVGVYPDTSMMLMVDGSRR